MNNQMVLIGGNALTLRTGGEFEFKNDIDIIADYNFALNYFKDINYLLNKTKGFNVCLPIDSGKKNIIKFNNHLNVELEITWPESTAELFYNIVINDPETIEVGDYIIPSLNALYTLKMSHRYLKNSPFFLKTMDHILLLRWHGAKISDRYKEFYNLRKKETYNYAHPKLNVNKDEFFKSDILYIYDHDSIHEAIKHLEKPAYLYFKKDNEEIDCSKDKFNSLSEMIKLYAVLEEAYVLALERSQICYPGKLTPAQSFEIALEKVCTSITSGWFREYAWENYHKVYHMALLDEFKYYERFLSKLNDGNVKLV